MWLEEMPVPQIGINDVLIKVLKTSICGTDVHIYNWDAWAQKTIHTPMAIDHEFVGRIEEIGDNMRDFKVGDLVSGEGHVVCGHCRNCMAGRRHLCMNTSGVGVNRDGAFAQYLSLPMTNVWYCDPHINTDILSFFDPLGNAVHTALSFDVLGEGVLITGAGPIGAMAAAVGRHAGAPHEKLDAVEAELDMKEGFDVGLEISGSADAFRDMLAHMCHGGKIALLGIQQGETAVDWNEVIFNGLTLKGIYGREMYETWYKMTSMIQTGLDVAPIITHRLPYTAYEEGFAAMRSGKSGKVILDWTD